MVNKTTDHAKSDFENLTNKALAWDYLGLGCRTRTESITYAIHKKKEENKHLVELTSSLADLEANIPSSLDNVYLNQINTVKGETEEIYNKKAIGCIIRSRCKFIDEYEKPSRYFLNLEKVV